MKRDGIVELDVLTVVPVELLPLLPGFVDRRSTDVKELRDMLLNNDYDQIFQLGHRLKGVGTGYGFQVISNMGADLEDAAVNFNRTRIVEVIKGLTMFVGVMRIRLKRRGF